MLIVSFPFHCKSTGFRHLQLDFFFLLKILYDQKIELKFHKYSRNICVDSECLHIILARNKVIVIRQTIHRDLYGLKWRFQKNFIVLSTLYEKKKNNCVT